MYEKAPRGLWAAPMLWKGWPALVGPRNKPVSSERQPGSRKASKWTSALGAKDGQRAEQMEGPHRLTPACPRLS